MSGPPWSERLARALAGTRPETWDRLAALASACIGLGLEIARVWEHASWASHPLLRYLAILVASAALLRRRSRPLPVAVVVLAATGLSMAFTPLFFLAYAAGRFWSGARAWQFAAVAVAELVVLTAIGSGPQFVRPGTVAGCMAVTLMVTGLLVAGTALRQRDEDRTRAALEARRLATDAVNEERGRLVREFHDLLGHDVAVLNVLAGSLQVTLDHPSPRTSALLDGVHEQCAAATEHLRSMTVRLRLRALEGEPPQALGEVLQRAVAQVRSAGTEVRTDPGFFTAYERLDLAAQDAAHRVVTEALTNVLRHAAGSEARLGLDLTDHDWTLVVENGPPPATASTAGSGGGTGLGLGGLRDRMSLLGGTLDAAPAPGGGFRVCARAPRNHGGTPT